MSDIPKSQNQVQIEGARFRSAVSESLIQAIGGLANYAAGLKLRVMDFTSSGTITFPSDCTFAVVEGIGGGGGGSSFGNVGNDFHGSPGGYGSDPGVVTRTVTPSSTWTVTIGNGGTGASSNGGNGGSGTDSTVFEGGTLIARFLGVDGGAGTGITANSDAQVLILYGVPGGRGGQNLTTAGSAGRNSRWANGGAGGAAATNRAGGGGGGAGLGNGGAGGNANPNADGSAGASAAANTGAGGGGGASGANYGAGGNGGSGRVRIYYYSSFVAT